MPVLQLMHEVDDVAPVVAQYFPAAQSMQAFVPDVGRYFPAGHCRHAEYPDPECWPAGQAVQAEASDAE